MKIALPRIAPLSALALILTLPASAWNSSKVQYDAEGRLVYPSDASGNRIPDYSHAGYKGGGVPLPEAIPVRVTIAPVEGDNTASIQAAIDAVGAMPLEADGYRGTVLLSAGVYDVGGTIRINKSGVVLAGVGDGEDPATNTILRRTGTSTANVITAGGGSDDQFKSEISGTRRPITTQRVAVGSRSFTVDDASGFTVGDNVVVYHPSTAAWITAMNQGGVTDANVWKPGEIDIRYHRYITAISGNTVSIDAPIFNHLDRSLSQSHLYKYNRAGVLTNIGIEDLLVDIVTAGPTSETHCEDAIEFVEAEDCWIRDSTARHFWHAGVQFAGSTRCTAERVRSIEPHSVVTGGRRYNFATYHSQLILFRDCFASYARHGYVANGTSSDSGNVALNCVLDRNITYSEGHRRWSTGLLFDGIVATNRTGNDVLGFYNRGNFGTGHGWAVGHGTIWRCDAAGGKILVQQPPTAQNYAIGCFGNISVSGPFTGPAGYREGNNSSGLVPQSLYLEQLSQRQNLAGSPDITAPTAPTALLASGITNTTVNLTWNLSTDDVGVHGYDVFNGAAFIGYADSSSHTLTGLAPATAYTITVVARDVAGNVSTASNAVAVTTTGTPPPPTIFFESESLVRLTQNANASVANETGSSGGQFASNFQYISLGADGVPPPPNSEWIEFTLPNIPAGTYNLVMRYKTHQTNRGILQLSVDGVNLGSPLNQHSSPATFKETDFGVVRFAAAGDRKVRLTVTGRDATSGAYTITSDTFKLVPDNTAPVISSLPNRVEDATSADGAFVTFSATATDNKDGSRPVTFSIPSGSLFPLGSTTVVASAQDFMGNVATKAFVVTVVDRIAPAISPLADIVLEATGPDGAAAEYSATATDIVDGDVGVVFSHNSGSVFPIGTTTVTVSAADDTENTATATFTVTVRDTTPPNLIVPADVTVEATSPAGATASFAGIANDLVSGSVAVNYRHASGSVFPLGTTTVTATATDAAGNSVSGTFSVTVQDTTAPVFVGLSATPDVIRVPNHRMVNVRLTATVQDAGDSAPQTRIISVASNQSVDGAGDGNTKPDWQVTGDLELQVRAERSGADGDRIYTITVESRDAFGNVSAATVDVTVLHDLGRN